MPHYKGEQNMKLTKDSGKFDGYYTATFGGKDLALTIITRTGKLFMVFDNDGTVHVSLGSKAEGYIVSRR